jgi:membrane dipeptidase
MLCAEMSRTGMILDASHLTDESFYDALDRFNGPVLASHSNCRALVPGDRQLSDDMIRRLIERGAVIGIAMDAWMLEPGWIRGHTTPENVSLEDAADHIDHICQLAGNARHVAIGSDLDGGYGTEQTPKDLDTIADLQKMPDILAGRGYSDEDVALIMHGNWVRFLQEHLPSD